MILNILSDFLFPKHCLVDRTVIQNGVSNFLSQRSFDRFPLCDHTSIITDRLRRSENFSENIESVFSLLDLKEDTNYSDLIHFFKYNSFKNIGLELSDHLANKIIAETDIQFDIIIPIPLFKSKLRERTFNQSEIISCHLSKRLRAEHDQQNLTRKLFTTTQTKLDQKDRRINIRDAFEINDSVDYSSKNILIVDDVITTGATISGISDILKTKKPENIYSASLAIAF